MPALGRACDVWSCVKDGSKLAGLFMAGETGGGGGPGGTYPFGPH